MSSKQLNHVKRATTSTKAWDALKNVFESRGPVRKATLYKQLLRMEKKPDVSISEYVSVFTQQAEKLEDAGIKIPKNRYRPISKISVLPLNLETIYRR